MNIILFHTHAILPNSQGISTVMITLRTLFREKGHHVIALAMHRLRTDLSEDPFQYYLPYEDVNCPGNVSFLCDLLNSHHIDKSLSVCANLEELKIIKECCKLCNVPMITALHNMILTPIYNIAAVKEFVLRSHHLMPVYYLLKTNIVRWLLSRCYIMRYRQYYRNVYTYSDAIVLLNKAMEAEFLKMIGVNSSNKTYIIPNTVNDNPSKVNTHKKNIVLWIGKMDTSIKRPDLMLKVWQMVEKVHPDWRLLMLGKGDGKGDEVLGAMKSLSKRYKLQNISFEGQVNTKPYYEDAKIVCVTSSHESFSLVIAEALVNGVVPMAFHSFPAAKELIEDGVNGLLISPFEIHDYAQKLSALMADENEWAFLQGNRMATLKKFNRNSVYQRWEELFLSIN